MGFGGKNTEEKIKNLIKEIERLKSSIGIASSIKTEKRNNFTEKEFMGALDEISEKAFDDQCTSSNPRYPLISELRQLFIYAYNGITDFEL